MIYPTIPTSPSYRNIEPRTSQSRREEAYWDETLLAELAKRTTLKTLPSIQMQAYRDYEMAKFGVLNRRGKNLGYNLYTDTCRLLCTAHRFVTDDPRRTKALTGFTPKTTPRRALTLIAKAYGYRYLRGLLAIEPELDDPTKIAEFRRERMVFKRKLELTADAAHAINNNGQSPGAVMDVILLFADELRTLCRWMDAVGLDSDAQQLRSGINAAVGATGSFC